MENKSIKVIDEHNIDREANKICVLDVDGSDYLTYSIERDNDNDNIFVSKLISNINGTSSMINIENPMEREKISNLVKELIKYSVDTEKDKTDTDVINLPSGVTVKLISKVIDKKEQNINVQKTYITTVKKAVTKVAADFYDFQQPVKIEEPVADIFPIFNTNEQEKVVEEKPVVNPIDETPKVEEKQNNEYNFVPPVMESPKIEPVESIPNVLPSENTLESTLPKVENSTLEVKTPEVVSPVVNKVESVEEPKKVKLDIPVLSIEKAVEQNSVIQTTPQLESVSSVKEPEPILPVSEPVNSVSSPAPTPVITPSVSEKPAVNDELVFDASKEVNLNEALDEVSSDKVVVSNDISSIREFGQDAPVINNTPEVVPNSSDEMVNNDVKILSRKRAGFANKKFFVVIAILFFVSACVFMGYEAFRYFQAVK